MKQAFLKIFTIATTGVLILSVSVIADPTTQTTTAPSTTQPTTGPTTTPTTGPTVINWDQAAKHVGEVMTVTGPVIGTHITGDRKNLALNVGKNFPDPTRFNVFMPYDPSIGDPNNIYRGKTVTVTGKIELYRRTKVAEIKTKAANVIFSKSKAD